MYILKYEYEGYNFRISTSAVANNIHSTIRTKVFTVLLFEFIRVL